jgi:hypothetical protein
MIIIEKWIRSLINQKPDISLFSNSFDLEDGMSLQEYINYESWQFTNLSHIYDLTTDFKIQILFKCRLNNFAEDKELIFFYIINSLDKIVCKMHLTIQNTFLISNQYYSQIVPKFHIENNNITKLGLAIKSKFPLKKIFCEELDWISLSEGDNFQNDKFYSAKFDCDNSSQNKCLNFTLILNNNGKNIIEKQKVFIDQFEQTLKPFILNNNNLQILNDKYPVHLSTWDIYKNNNNWEYPRNISIDTSFIEYFTVTDSIDNDWLIQLK